MIMPYAKLKTLNDPTYDIILYIYVYSPRVHTTDFLEPHSQADMNSVQEY